MNNGVGHYQMPGDEQDSFIKRCEVFPLAQKELHQSLLVKEVQGEIIMFMPEKNSRVGIAALMFMDVREKPPENLEKKRERG